MASLFGTMVRKARDEAEWSQERLARYCGVCKSAVCYWESGERFPRHRPLVKLARFMKRSTSELYEAAHGKAA